MCRSVCWIFPINTYTQVHIFSNSQTLTLFLQQRWQNVSCNGICLYITFLVMSVYSFVYTGTILIIDYKDNVQNITSVFKISNKWVSSEIKRHIAKTMLCQTTYTCTFKKSSSGSILWTQYIQSNICSLFKANAAATCSESRQEDTTSTTTRSVTTGSRTRWNGCGSYIITKAGPCFVRATYAWRWWTAAGNATGHKWMKQTLIGGVSTNASHLAYQHR